LNASSLMIRKCSGVQPKQAQQVTWFAGIAPSPVKLLNPNAIGVLKWQPVGAGAHRLTDGAAAASGQRTG
jgi:hypothetical protein